MASLDVIQNEAMCKILSGDNNILSVLRNQYDSSKRVEYEKTDVGCYVNFEVPKSIPSTDPKAFRIGDVFLMQDGLTSPIGFILFIENGYLSFLEVYTYGDDILPDEFQNYSFYYSKDGNRGNGKRKWSV